MTAIEKFSSTFKSHLKILFDILDENHNGFVRLGDIESHWVGNDCVIPGNIVMQSLRKMASPSGRLSFDTLIVGFERALTLWKSNTSAGPDNITFENDGQGSSQAKTSGLSVNCSTNIPDPDFARNQRYVHKSSETHNILAKSVNAEFGHGSVTSRVDTDGLKLWQRERVSAGYRGDYDPVQKKKGMLMC